jgi:hypothetical protein
MRVCRAETTMFDSAHSYITFQVYQYLPMTLDLLGSRRSRRLPLHHLNLSADDMDDFSIGTTSSMAIER